MRRNGAMEYGRTAAALEQRSGPQYRGRWLVDQVWANEGHWTGWLWAEGRHADNNESWYWQLRPEFLWDDAYDFTATEFGDLDLIADVVWRTLGSRFDPSRRMDDPRWQEARRLEDLADRFGPSDGVYRSFEVRIGMRKQATALHLEMTAERRAAHGFPPPPQLR